MPFVSGFLRIRKRGRPGHPLPEPEEPVDPDYGVDEGERPEVEPPDPGDGIWGPTDPRPTPPIAIRPPKPPPGIWPPPTPEHPWIPVPPGGGRPPSKPIDPDARPEHPIEPGGEYPSQLPSFPPGLVWPPINAQGKFLVLAWVPGYGYKYIVVDVGLKPSHPIAPGGEEPHPEPR